MMDANEILSRILSNIAYQEETERFYKMLERRAGSIAIDLFYDRSQRDDAITTAIDNVTKELTESNKLKESRNPLAYVFGIIRISLLHSHSRRKVEPSFLNDSAMMDENDEPTGYRMYTVKSSIQKPKTKDQIKRLYSQGMRKADIARKLGLSRARVTQALRKETLKES